MGFEPPAKHTGVTLHGYRPHNMYSLFIVVHWDYLELDLGFRRFLKKFIFMLFLFLEYFGLISAGCFSASILLTHHLFLPQPFPSLSLSFPLWDCFFEEEAVRTLCSWLPVSELEQFLFEEVIDVHTSITSNVLCSISFLFDLLRVEYIREGLHSLSC